MSAELLKDYVNIYGALDPIESLAPQSAAGTYLISGEDEDGLMLVARLAAVKLAGLDKSRVFDNIADIVTYPIPPEKKSAKGGKKTENAKSDISVDDIREIVDSLYLTPFELDRRFYIIERAESMSEICQNKLLKSLEEPPEHVCFLLCASRALLPTVESRCKIIRVPPFSDGEVLRELQARHGNSDAVTLAARACRGNFGMAERMLLDKDFNATYRSALDILRAATGSSAFGKTAALYDKFTRERADATLSIMEFLLADVARLIIGLDTVFDRSDIQKISQGFTAYSAAACADIVREARRNNGGNCMITAVMDEAVLKIMEEKALCRR